jgi:hypothetical protein
MAGRDRCGSVGVERGAQLDERVEPLEHLTLDLEPLLVGAGAVETGAQRRRGRRVGALNRGRPIRAPFADP